MTGKYEVINEDPELMDIPIFIYVIIVIAIILSIALLFGI